MSEKKSPNSMFYDDTKITKEKHILPSFVTSQALGCFYLESSPGLLTTAITLRMLFSKTVQMPDNNGEREESKYCLWRWWTGGGVWGCKMEKVLGRHRKARWESLWQLPQGHVCPHHVILACFQKDKHNLDRPYHLSFWKFGSLSWKSWMMLMYHSEFS